MRQGAAALAAAAAPRPRKRDRSTRDDSENEEWEGGSRRRGKTNDEAPRRSGRARAQVGSKCQGVVFRELVSCYLLWGQRQLFES